MFSFSGQMIEYKAQKKWRTLHESHTHTVSLALDNIDATEKVCTDFVRRRGLSTILVCVTANPAVSFTHSHEFNSHSDRKRKEKKKPFAANRSLKRHDGSWSIVSISNTFPAMKTFRIQIVQCARVVHRQKLQVAPVRLMWQSD